MSLFEFLMVFVSIIVGLGVTEILSGVATRIRYRHTTNGYWLHSCGVALIFIALLQTWWELWSSHDAPEWSFLALILMLIPPASLYLIAHLIFPEPISNSDIRRYYYENLRPVWALAVLTAASSAVFRPLAFGSELLTPDNASTGILLLGFVVLLLTRNPRVHSILIPSFLALLLWDVVRWSPTFGST